MNKSFITLAIGILIAVVLVGPVAATIQGLVRAQDCAYSAAPSSLRPTTSANLPNQANAVAVPVPVSIGLTANTAVDYPAGTLCLSAATTGNISAILSRVTAGEEFIGDAVAVDSASNPTPANFARAVTNAGDLHYGFASARAIIVLIPLGIVAGLVYWGYSAFTGRREGAF